MKADCHICEAVRKSSQSQGVFSGAYVLYDPAGPIPVDQAGVYQPLYDPAHPRETTHGSVREKKSHDYFYSQQVHGRSVQVTFGLRGRAHTHLLF